MCSVPVTLGGGMAMENDGPEPEGEKYPLDSQVWYHFCSIWLGSYLSIGALVVQKAAIIQEDVALVAWEVSPR